jgi:drug/metabolite transporter (DMT)-like permease
MAGQCVQSRPVRFSAARFGRIPHAKYAADVAYVLALTSAVLYGAADFVGGLAARRAPTIAVVLVSQAAGLALLATGLLVLRGTAPPSRDLMWGVAAGLTGGVGVALLYRALAVGTMAVVAPVTAVCAVIIPVVATWLAGERPRHVTVLGILLALVAIVLVSQSRGSGAEGQDVPPFTTSSSRSGLGLAFLSGVAIGFFFLSLARTTAEAGLWPLVAARGASVVLFLAVAATGAASLRMPSDVAIRAAGAGVLDVGANALYLIATRHGALSIVVTLASLYPASTVILARIVLAERLNRWQIAGIVCALIAVVVIVG